MAQFFKYAGRAGGRYTLPITAVTIAGFGFATASVRTHNDYKTAAEEQFSTSSIHPPPQGWTGRVWRIRNDYPKSSDMVSATGPGFPTMPLPGVAPKDDAPWLKIDFMKDPLKYCEVIKQYCLEGNSQNDFNVQDNKVRDWFHAPWMHYRDETTKNSSCSEREPLNGLTFERATPAFEFSRTQDRALQTWACGYYNRAGASVFGDMWQDPNKPDWSTNKKFPKGSAVFKILLNDATDHHIPLMKGAPGLQAQITETPSDGSVPKNARIRNKFSSEVRLIQMDFAVVDERAPIGWVFGTFMYDKNHKSSDPWQRMTPVGVMWGNDPTLNQKAYEAGQRAQESWINPDADELRLALKGSRPSWGWNGRMNGPADNFVSACASCHSVSLRDNTSNISLGPFSQIVKDANGNYVPKDPVDKTDGEIMRWFRNVPAGVPFNDDENGDKGRGDASGDYSLQLQIGWHNFAAWKETQKTGVMSSIMSMKKMVVGDATDPGRASQRELLRQGGDIEYEQSSE